MYTLLATFRYSSEHLKQLFRVFFGVIRSLRDKRETIVCVCSALGVENFSFPNFCSHETLQVSQMPTQAQLPVHLDGRGLEH
jgi:hypothetical protein